MPSFWNPSLQFMSNVLNQILAQLSALYLEKTEFIFGSFKNLVLKKIFFLKKSITFLFVEVLGLFTENVEFQLLWNLRLLSKHHQTALYFSASSRTVFLFNSKQEGHLGKWAMYLLQRVEGELESCTVHCKYIPEASFTNFFWPRSWPSDTQR